VNRDLWGRFGVRFLASAHKRIADARGLLGGGDAKAAMRVAAEFHGLAGEAGMIGIEEIDGEPGLRDDARCDRREGPRTRGARKLSTVVVSTGVGRTCL